MTSRQANGEIEFAILEIAKEVLVEQSEADGNGVPHEREPDQSAGLA